MTNTQIILIFLVIAFLVWRFSSIAGRLDRVHVRLDQAATSLELQLARRASAVSKLLVLNLLDPVSSNVLAEEVESVTTAAERSLSEYIWAESEFTQALVAVFDDEEAVQELANATDTRKILSDLAQACRRVQLARRFHNDAVGAAQLLHRRKVVRWFKLAGHTEVPSALDMDDSVPIGLEIFA